MCCRKRRVLICHLLARDNCLVVLSRIDVNESSCNADDRCLRIKLVGTIDFSKGSLLPAANQSNSGSVPPVPSGIVRVEFESPLELSLSSGKVPVVLHLVVAQNSVGTCQSSVQLQCLSGGGVRLRKAFAGAAITNGRQSVIGLRETRIRQSVAGVFGDGLIEIGGCGFNV